MLNERQHIEIFHLLFLRVLAQRIDQGLYALKGGCNLRFYFRSVRYSEDMDLDVDTMAVGTLRSNVNRVLESPALRQNLLTYRLELAQTSEPKQTSTTQRWKIALRHLDTGRDTPTKIEFSRRSPDGQAVVEPVHAEIVQQYRLFPVLVPHYGIEAAFAQKVAALALREQVQSRDIFDLKLLLDAGGGRAPLTDGTARLLGTAIDQAMAVDYAQFSRQVVPYLDPTYQAYYASPSVWSSLQETVIDALAGLAA